jgi:hypothetical protein
MQLVERTLKYIHILKVEIQLSRRNMAEIGTLLFDVHLL